MVTHVITSGSVSATGYNSLHSLNAALAVDTPCEANMPTRPTQQRHHGAAATVVSPARAVHVCARRPHIQPVGAGGRRRRFIGGGRWVQRSTWTTNGVAIALCVAQADADQTALHAVTCRAAVPSQFGLDDDGRFDAGAGARTVPPTQDNCSKPRQAEHLGKTLQIHVSLGQGHRFPR